jgi:Four helix bundle sensory module for signal transduction
MSGVTHPLGKTVMQGPQSWLSLRHLALRPKLILAFIAIAAMAGLCGVVGLVFVNRITTTMSGFVDVTTPLLTESVSLVENAHRMRSTFLVAIEKGEDLDPLSRQLSDLHSESQRHIERLRSLSSRDDVGLRFDEMKRYDDAFHTTLAPIIEASARKRAVAAAFGKQSDAFLRGYRTLQQVLVSLTDRAEGILIKAEDEAKVEVQTRSATVDGLGDRISDITNGIYPVLQNANKLLRELEQIEGTGRRLAQANLAQLLLIDQAFKRSFRVTTSISRRLGSRLVDAEGQATLIKLQDGLAQIESAASGAAGLMEYRRDEVLAQVDIEGGQQLFDQIERAYFGLLNKTEQAVRDLNLTAKAETAEEIAQARTITSTSVLFTLAVAVVFSLFFAHRLTAPLVKLAAQVSDVRTSGQLKVLPATPLPTAATRSGRCRAVST